MKWWRRWRDRHYRRSLHAWQDEVGEPRFTWSVSDSRPDDLEKCGSCGGHGAILHRTDWETGHSDIDQCSRCHGSGLDPAHAPYWAVA